MSIHLNINKGETIRAFYLFFVIVSIQIGVGILKAPHDIIIKARQDAWLAIIIAYCGILFIVSIMFAILSRYENADIFAIQEHLFGRAIGKILGTIYIIYFFLGLLSVILNFLQIVHVFLFPTMSSIVFVGILLFLIGYTVLGGVRVVIGVIFLFIILSLWVVFFAYDPIRRVDMTHFFPLFNTPMSDLLKAAKSITFAFLGPEILLLIYPFIENKRKAKLPVYLGVTYTTFMLLLATVISIGYFSLEGIHRIKWPVISLYKSVSFSFMERFDYFIIVEWLMVIMNTTIVLMWAIVYGTERLFKIKQKTSLLVFSSLTLLIVVLINTDKRIKELTELTSQIGFWIVYVYPIILLPIVLLKRKSNPSKGCSS